MGSSFRRQTEHRLILGGFLIVTVIGGALIWMIYGATAAAIAVAIIAAGALSLGGLWLLLRSLEAWSRRE